MFKTILSHSAVLLIGGGIGCLATKQLYHHRYSKLAHDEINSILKMYAPEPRTSLDHTEEKCCRDDANLTAEAPNQIIYEKQKESWNQLVRSDTPKSRIAYHEAMKESMKGQLGIVDDGEDHYNVFDTQEAIPDTYLPTERHAPYEISEDEYADEFLAHEKVSLAYYVMDDILCEEQNDEVVYDVVNSVGTECFITLQTQNTAWVRNEMLSIDYEICVVNNKYEDIVNGDLERPLSPREKREAKRGES